MTELVQPVGEHPEVTIASEVREIDKLRAENILLRAELDKARAERDNAAAQVSNYQRYYTRSGW